MSSIAVRPVITRRDLRAFVKFPWRIYRSEVRDPNWVPPLISERLEYLDPARGPFYKYADVTLFLAHRGREVLGTIAAFVNRRLIEPTAWGPQPRAEGLRAISPRSLATKVAREAREAWALELNRVADVARREKVSIRKLCMEDWDQEVATARYLFNTTLSHLAEHVPLTEAEFRRLANQLRPFLDPDLALFAEADGRTVGFCVAIPDINRVLIHLNGRLLPFGWLKMKRYMGQIDVITFKLMGILEKYRRRGIDALLYLETVKAFFNKGYEWLDGSLTSEKNPTINLIAQRLGAERYKRYRLYQMSLGKPRLHKISGANEVCPDT